MSKIISVVGVEQKIFYFRSRKVMLDFDLATLYGVTTKRLKEQVKRNKQRFPEDFMFELTWQEVRSLRSQNATLERVRNFSNSSQTGRHSKYLPFAFTEQGIAMLSTVLNSERAIQVNIAIMRAFVKIREVLATHKELAARLAELERRMDKKDNEIMALFEAIRKLVAPPPEKPKGKLGFYLPHERD